MARRDFSGQGTVGGGKELKLLLNLNVSLEDAALFVYLFVCLFVDLFLLLFFLCLPLSLSPTTLFVYLPCDSTMSIA